MQDITNKKNDNKYHATLFAQLFLKVVRTQSLANLLNANIRKPHLEADGE